MRKFIFSFIVVIMAAMLIGGCSSAPKEVSETEHEPPETYTQINWFEIIPNPEEMFPDNNISIIMSSPTGIYRVEDHTDGDWEAYVEEAKKMGFTDVKHKSVTETGTKLFMAYDKDHRYYLEAAVNGENNIFDITIKEAEE